ncbi:MAG: cobalt ECF transporter T component CbiQ [Deltaproteobacteria bacterium]|nr:cobalt ECF transporter T component CbiQ [Deltaproteobacteria bacterium]
MQLFSEYFKKSNLLSRVDARIKLIVSLILLIMVLSYRGIVFPLLILCLGIILCIRMKIPLRVLFLRFSEPLVVASVVLILKFLTGGKDTLFSIEIAGIRLAGHTDGLMEGLMIAARILGAVSIIALLGFSTPFTEFMAGLSWFRIPKGFIEILMFAYRYIFVLLEDAMVIYNAQKNRLGYSSVRRGLNSFGVLTGSLILKAFEQSQNTTVAMAQRGYDGNMPILKHKPFKRSELLFSTLFVTTMGFLWRI